MRNFTNRPKQSKFEKCICAHLEHIYDCTGSRQVNDIQIILLVIQNSRFLYNLDWAAGNCSALTWMPLLMRYSFGSYKSDICTLWIALINLFDYLMFHDETSAPHAWCLSGIIRWSFSRRWIIFQYTDPLVRYRPLAHSDKWKITLWFEIFLSCACLTTIWWIM